MSAAIIRDTAAICVLISSDRPDTGKPGKQSPFRWMNTHNGFPARHLAHNKALKSRHNHNDDAADTRVYNDYIDNNSRHDADYGAGGVCNGHGGVCCSAHPGVQPARKH